MKYIETNRTVEAHSECILFLYFLDAKGMPVPNIKIKLWAGPPPNGHPPYYEDESADNINRLTDTNGKFQFIVANPTPTQPLDFFAQALSQDDAPLSDPVHLPFPPHEARWVIVTLGPEAAPLEDGGAPVGGPEMEVQGSSPIKPAAPAQLPNEPVTPVVGLPAANKVIFERTAPAKPQPPPKLFAHYILFGPGSHTGTLTNLILALDYIIRYAPVVGFAPDEAKNAEHVTIVGDSTAVSSATEQLLREAGCTVTRLTASDSYALENLFKQLLDSGSPYLPH